ncbi:PspA domain-containing protein [Gordonia sp. OPL2]|uniref:PspA domain-containing protein n=1 Tax=Gordonia sp. OPL2 TaxID=2486274 RepID=UPI0021CCF70E|nr:PspA domain-containing protein [Gordonia sp. OPL2]
MVSNPSQAPATPPPPGYTPPIPDPNYTNSGVPTFDFVRDKIENRISTAIGSEELAHAGPEGQQVDEMMRKRDEAARKKLEEIRKSMGK